MNWFVHCLSIVVTIVSGTSATAQVNASDLSVESFCSQNALDDAMCDQLGEIVDCYRGTIDQLDADLSSALLHAREREEVGLTEGSLEQRRVDLDRFKAMSHYRRGMDEAFITLWADGRVLLEPTVRPAWEHAFRTMRRDWGLADVVGRRDGVVIPDLLVVVRVVGLPLDDVRAEALRQYERVVDERLSAWQALGSRWIEARAHRNAAQRAKAMQRLGRERDRLQRQILALTHEAAARVAHGLDVVDAAAFRREFWAQSYPAWSRPGPFREVLRAIDDDLRADPIVQDAIAHYAARIDAWQLRMADAIDAARQLTHDEIDERHDRLRAAWDVNDGGATVDAIQDELGFAPLLAERRAIEADAVRALGEALGAEVIERQSPVVRMLMRWAAEDR